MEEAENPNLEEKEVNEGKVREELKTDKTGFVKIGDIILLLMKRGSYCGMISADGVISQSVTVIPRESDNDKGANILTRSCLFRIETATKVTKEISKKSESELKQSLGKPLTYGEKIQLRHLHSSSFISVFTQSMAAEAGCLQVSMTEESDEKSWFEITATNKLRKEGEVIRYSDSVCLVMISNKSQYYLHAEEKILNSSSRPDVNASGLFSPWMIRRFINYDLFSDSSPFVRTGDSFRIKHHICGGFLCTKSLKEGQTLEVFVQEGNLTSNSLWEVQRTATFFGGSAKWNELYRVKHVATGKFLRETSEGIFLTSKGYDDGTLFNFVPEQAQLSKDIPFGSVLAIKTMKNRLFNIEYNDMPKAKVKGKNQIYKLNVVVNAKNFSGVAFILEDVAEAKTAHVYKLSLVNPFLSDFYEYVTSMPAANETSDLNPDKVKNFYEKCNDFKNLLNNISQHIILKASEEVDLPTRQNAIRELNITDVLLKTSQEIYTRLTPPNEFSFHYKEVLEKIYSLLYNSIKSNMKNCKHLFLSESILLSQLELGLSIGIGRILKEIFKNSTVVQSLDEKNFQIWYNYLKPITKENLKEQCLYLSILQYLCSSNGIGDKRYQSQALKKLTNPQNDFSIIKFDYLNKRPVIEFDFPKKKMNLKKFLEINPFLDHLGVVVDEGNFLVEQEPYEGSFYVEDVSENLIYSNYVAHAVEFLASVCASRFAKAINQLQIVKSITLEHIASVLRNVNISDKLRAAYANLCRVIFIDIDPLLSCSLHKERCFVWDDLKKMDDQIHQQRKEVLKPIRDILRFFWDKDGGVKIYPQKESRSIALIISFSKLASTIIDLELEDEDFIEFFMQPLCFFMMKDCGSTDHWSSKFIQSVYSSLETNYRPSLEYKLSLFYLDILRSLETIVELRQNLHILEFLLYFKEKHESTHSNFQISLPEQLEELDQIHQSTQPDKERFDEILSKLDWDVSVKYNEQFVDDFGLSYEVEREKIYNMDIYLLELLFDVSGGKNKEIHNKALNVLIQDITLREVLSNELKHSEFLFSNSQVDLYKSLLLLGKRLQSTVTLLVQEKDEAHDSSQVGEAIKDSIVIIQDCIGMYKTSQNKVLYQNLLNHSGTHHLLIEILGLKLTRNLAQLFQVTIAALLIFVKKNKRNQEIVSTHFMRMIELIPEISITRLICEVLSDCRLESKGDVALEAIFALIDSEGFSIEYSQFLRAFLKDFNLKYIKKLQVRVMKMVFKSQGIKRIMGDETQDVFAPFYFLDPAVLASSKFALHLEILKLVISCSINNSFGILQSRKLMTFANLRNCLLKPELTYKAKLTYFKFMQLVYFSKIEVEIEPELSVNLLDQLIRDVLIPDLMKVKSSYLNVIEISKKGAFPLINKGNVRKRNPKLSAFEQDVVEFWMYLSNKATWFDDNFGVLDIFTDVFNDSVMTLDDEMQGIVRDLKLVLFEINDLMQHSESNHQDIDFSRYIIAINHLRESLPRTALNSTRPGQKFSDNLIIKTLQKYIIDNKLTLDEAFQQFDTDGSGLIEFEEFRILIRKLVGNVPSAEIERAFNQIDEDRSGTLQVSELERIVRRYFSKHPRMVRVKKEGENENEENILEEPQGPEPKDVASEVKLSFEKYCKTFLDSCIQEDMKILVLKIKEKYMDPINVSLDESITKLGQVFYKQRHKIYLIRIFKMLIPKFTPNDALFDERDLEEENLKKELVRCQCRLSDAGVLKIALDLINEDSPVSLVQETVTLMIDLMRFGNSKIQASFLDLLRSQNHSEMFAYIRSMLRSTRDSIIKKHSDSIKADANSKIQEVLIIPDSDHEDEDEDRSSDSSRPSPSAPSPLLAEHMLSLLQMCCENCFLPFQNFLRQQESAKLISINMVDEIVNFLVNIKQIGGCLLNDPAATALVIQAFETLIDSCKGPCVENQELLGGKKKLYKFINSILQLYSVNPKGKALFKSVVRFLEALLEGNFSNDLAKKMIDFIDFQLLADLALGIYKDFIVPKKDAFLQESIVGTNLNNVLLMNIKSLYVSMESTLPELELEEWDMVSVGFRITIITVKLREKFRNIEELRCLCFSDEHEDYKGQPIIENILSGIDNLGGSNESIVMDVKKLAMFLIRYSSFEVSMNDAYEFYTSLIASVEIDKDGKIEKCYFQMPTAMVYLNERMRKAVIYGVDRDSNEEQIKSFLFITEKIQLELSHLQIISRIGFLGWMISRYEFFAKLLFIAIICANLIVIGTVTSISDTTYNTDSFPGQALMIVLGIAIMIIAAIMYLLSILMSYPMIIFNRVHNSLESGEYESESTSAIQGTIKMNHIIESSSKDLQHELQNYTKFFFYVVFDLENLINIIIFILAILGWYNPFFYGIMMLDILRRSETLKNVLLVITKNKKSLILTVVLLVIFVYIFGVWGFSLLRQYYMESQGSEYQLNTYCDTLFNCVASSLSLGIRAGGGIGDVIFPAVRKDKYYELRLIFDITFFIIVIIIMLNIFFGIIVDTFAELRDARREIEHDIENFCFVCGRAKHEFELRGSGWNQHIQIEHNVWAYLAYILYIKRKPITECDGIEKYVKNKLMQNDITFFPTTSLCLETGKEKIKDAKELMQEDLRAIQEKLAEINSKLQG